MRRFSGLCFLLLLLTIAVVACTTSGQHTTNQGLGYSLSPPSPPPTNHPPSGILSLWVFQSSPAYPNGQWVEIDDWSAPLSSHSTFKLQIAADDPDGDDLTYRWFPAESSIWKYKNDNMSTPTAVVIFPIAIPIGEHKYTVWAEIDDGNTTSLSNLITLTIQYQQLPPQ